MCYKKTMTNIIDFLRGRQPTKRLRTASSIHIRMSQAQKNFWIKQKMRYQVPPLICVLVDHSV
jgi:hypothetical protein